MWLRRLKWRIIGSPDGVPLRPIHSPVLSHQVGLNTAVVVVLIEHVWVSSRVGPGQMTEHRIVSGASIALSGGVRAVPGIVGYFGATVEVG